MHAGVGPLAVALAVLAAIGCGGGDKEGDGGRSALPRGAERVNLDPAEFTTAIDNPYWPMAPGSTWVYRETDRNGTEQRVEVTVTDRVRRVDGVKARVVHDVVTQRGALVENTYDWYAQDRAGNVWYLGESTREYENSKVVSTEGSWAAGVDGAQAGVVMPADPRVGMSYRQEQYAGHAEDRARILSLDEQAEVPFGRFRRVLMTKDYTPLEPRVLEHKLYARGVGPVLVVALSGGGGSEELIRFTSGR
jgi:hypothetical protein